MTSPSPASYTSSGLLYVSFRAAFLTTYQELLDEFKSDRIPGSSSGFLAQVSIAAGCASQVQLDVLFKTWQRIKTGHEDLTVLEQCVCYYAVGELARLGKANDRRLVKRAANGPRVVEIIDLTWLAATLRTIQITWPFPGNASHLQEEMSLSDVSDDVKNKRTLADDFLDLLGQWTVSPHILNNAAGLLTPVESRQLGNFFSEHPRLMNL
ncbi:MAG: hypothetical protein P8J37_24580 [Fuerstiella sp.]|nr:hypothetical protein [Fuerstiella sp.]